MRRSRLRRILWGRCWGRLVFSHISKSRYGAPVFVLNEAVEDEFPFGAAESRA
jgi:hypothetical protein